MTVVGDLAYITHFSTGLQILNIANPASPYLVGSYDTPGDAESVTIVGNLAYVADGRAGRADS